MDTKLKKPEATVSAIVIKKDGTRIDLGKIAGKRTSEDVAYSNRQRRKLEKLNKEG